MTMPEWGTLLHVWVIFLLAVGIALAVGGAHFRFVVARLLLALFGRLPWSTMAFLAGAHDRGVLRQVGAVYQFRHARLTDRLAQRR